LITNGGKLQYVSTVGGTGMLFSFALSYTKGGQYQCISFSPTTAMNPAATSSFVEIAVIDTNNVADHWVSDFTVIFMKSYKYSTAQYIGGNKFGADYFQDQIGLFDHSFDRYTTDCLIFPCFTSVITTGFNNFCIMNGCGSVSYYCPESRGYSGQVYVRGFATVTAPVTDTVNPTCNLNAVL